MIAALLYLQFHSLKNRLWARLRRLKKPKYLAGAIVGGLYFYFYFFRWFFLGGKAAMPKTSAESLGLYESLGALILFGIVLLAWIVPRERAALAFSEAEVAFLFPAPISRRTLVHYKLLRSQLAILFTTLFLALISRRAVAGGHAWIRMAGWWLVLSTLNLHFLGSSFARTMLLERGISNWQRRGAVLLTVAILVGTTILWGRHTMVSPRLQDFDSLHNFFSYQQQLLDSGPAPYVLYPFRIMVRPYLAANAWTFLHALWPVLCLLGLHYWWVIRANVAFEEASVDLSRKIADRMAAARAGRWQPGTRAKKPKRPPFELRPTGLPAIALLWKNLVAAGHFFTLRLWFLLIWMVGFSAILASTMATDSDILTAIGSFCLMLTAMSLLLGPQVLRQDFRQDLPFADILKMYPMRGWQVALGELLAPAAILSAIQWCLLIVAVGFCSHFSSQTELTLPARLALGTGAAMVLPMLNLVLLLIPNLAVLLFPGWFHSGKDSPQGIEVTGQRLIFMLGQMVVFVFALIPAAGAFIVVFLLCRYAVGWAAAVPPAALTAAVVLAVEAGLGLVFLGRLFDRLDLSSESTG